jgi:hypothetical protein
MSGSGQSYENYVDTSPIISARKPSTDAARERLILTHHERFLHARSVYNFQVTLAKVVQIGYLSSGGARLVFSF